MKRSERNCERFQVVLRTAMGEEDMDLREALMVYVGY